MSDEEFNNFMHKVNQVSNIVTKLASNDKALQEIGDLEAKEFLGESGDQKFEDVEHVHLQVKSDRTVLNQKALRKNDNPAEQSQEAFMEEMSKDAERRFQDKCKRKEKMETYKKQATLAFKRGEFEKALTLYNKAIEQIKDSCVLYTNRALTYVNLKIYDKAIKDCQTALKLKEDSLKAQLLLAKSLYLIGELEEYEKTVNEVRSQKKDDVVETEIINEFLNKLKEEG